MFEFVSVKVVVFEADQPVLGDLGGLPWRLYLFSLRVSWLLLLRLRLVVPVVEDDPCDHLFNPFWPFFETHLGFNDLIIKVSPIYFHNRGRLLLVSQLIS